MLNAVLWEHQLASMIDSDRLDLESLSDLAVAYTAETGDETVLGGPLPTIAVPVFIPLWKGARSISKSTSGEQARSYVGSRDGTHSARSYSMGKDGYFYFSDSNDESWSLSDTRSGPK